MSKLPDSEQLVARRNQQDSSMIDSKYEVCNMPRTRDRSSDQIKTLRELSDGATHSDPLNVSVVYRTYL